MITIYRKENSKIQNESELELRGLSTNTKPTEINGKPVPNGTAFVEINTGYVYLYDADSETWIKI